MLLPDSTHVSQVYLGVEFLNYQMLAYQEREYARLLKRKYYNWFRIFLKATLRVLLDTEECCEMGLKETQIGARGLLPHQSYILLLQCDSIYYPI